MRVRGLMLLGVLDGCGFETQPERSARATSVQEADPDRLALEVGADPEVCDQQCSATATDVTRSFVVTDPDILARFPLRRVLDQLIALAGTTGSTPDTVWQQWWMSQRARTPTDPVQYPFCDDNGSTINSFPITCPRSEYKLGLGDTVESHAPVALVNRFDLAPMDGSHCGEYRIVYALGAPGATANVGGRNFLILEGVLPNPDPGCGLAACLPVAQFWQGLSDEPDVLDRADLLEQFYFDGICGFEPVVTPEHYGLDCVDGSGYGGGCGQIRTNQFVESTWNLREFTLERDCTVPGCELLVQQTTVAQNPHPSLFSSTAPLFPSFEADFLAEVDDLRLLPSPDGVVVISTAISSVYDAGESVVDGAPFGNDYVPDTVFHGSIAAELLVDGFPPTVDSTDVAERATTQSCAGCHQLSTGDDLGNADGSAPNVVWPFSGGFVHIDENSQLSPALLNDFLPHRQSVLEQFLTTTCGAQCLGVDEFIVKDVVVLPEVPRPLVRFRLVDRETYNVLLPGLRRPDTLSGSLVH
jgi:hypothetical protein